MIHVYIFDCGPAGNCCGSLHNTSRDQTFIPQGRIFLCNQTLPHIIANMTGRCTCQRFGSLLRTNSVSVVVKEQADLEKPATPGPCSFDSLAESLSLRDLWLLSKSAWAKSLACAILSLTASLSRLRSLNRDRSNHKLMLLEKAWSSFLQVMRWKTSTVGHATMIPRPGNEVPVTAFQSPMVSPGTIASFCVMHFW